MGILLHKVGNGSPALHKITFIRDRKERRKFIDRCAPSSSFTNLGNYQCTIEGRGDSIDVQLNHMAKGPKEISLTAFDIVTRSTGTPSADDFAKIERATKGAEARSEKLSPERRS